MSDIAQKVAENFSRYPKKPFTKGQILVHAGSEPDCVFYVASGKVRQYDITSRGDEVVVNVFKPGAFFPMLWAITQKPNRYFFDALEPVEAHAIPRVDAVTFLRNNPDVLFDLLQRVYIGMDGVLERMVRLMSGSAKERLIFELLTECRRFGVQQESGYTITISEGELGTRAGLTRETVSREMRKLQALDLVELDQGVIYVKDLTSLEQQLKGGA